MRNVAFYERYQSTGKVFADAAAAIYGGVDRETDAAVFIKVMEGEPDPARRLAFTREAQLLSSLQHPSFPKLLADHSSAVRPFVVLEGIRGQPFDAWVADRRPRASVALHLLSQLASALHALHSSGHANGELTPGMLWVRGQGTLTEVTLLSTGRATPVGPDAATLRPIPRPAPPPSGFVAPELFALHEPGETIQATERSDLYGAGAIVYRYLTGHPPVAIAPSDPAEVAIERIRTAQPDLAKVERGLRPIFERLLAKRPAARYPSAVAVLEAIAALPSSGRATAISPGDRVGDQYVVHSVLGEGGFGVTVLARDETLQRDVAIKFLHRGDAEDLLGEARAMARVTHPNVAAIYGYGMHEGIAYLVMQYLQGEPLSRVLETATEPLGVTDVVTILDGTAMGVEAIHEAGLVHGDLKPANIVVGPAFRIGVTDFGLVKAVDHFVKQAKRIDGTPAYLAPEHIRSRVRPQLAHRMDVYALGILAYELITGSPPFDGPDRSLVMQRHLHAPVTPPSELAGRLERLDSVVLRALHKDPKRRTPDVATFRQELREALADDEEATEGLRILLVDPDRDERTAIVQVIEKLVPAAHVTQAAIGSAALRRAAKRRPDLVLVELAMPDMNGVELLAQLRAVVEDAPPAVILTANGSAADWPLLRALGARAFMPKPVDEEIFALVLEKLLDRG
ncbi:MAG: protein kinase [Deltaproteobacteria bacterium]|nr:protein kinase [Deltaproteobacteria bacterium]